MKAGLLAWPPPLSPLVIAAVNGGVLRAWSGWMRAVTVYCVAGAAIVYYLVAKVVNKYVLRLEGSDADSYWERRHTRAAPFVVTPPMSVAAMRTMLLASPSPSGVKMGRGPQFPSPPGYPGVGSSRPEPCNS